VNRDALEYDLTRLGLAIKVEERDRLAVLVPDASVSVRRAEMLQREIASLASKHGFTHVAIELTEDWCSGAPLPRDQPD
jgi:hypothetical protein